MAGRVENLPDPSKLTYEDYVNLPDDGRRYEILDGELVVSRSPTSRHQLVSHNLVFALSSWVRANGLGRMWAAPLDLILADTVVMQPDLIFVSKSRAAIVTMRGLEATPDLVIEILSASTASRDRGVKMRLYARHGVPRYWIVDADARILEVYALRGEAYERAVTYRDSDHADFDVPAGFGMNLADAWSED
jgi:Uma2 family endonuclease